MEYTVHKLAQISKISTRTLRYYDSIGLLNPARVSSSGYRIYGKAQVDTLQQILFYRELGFGLDEIKQMLTSVDFDQQKAMESHLAALLQKKNQVETLITNVKQTIETLKGEAVMSDREKFEGFKQKLIEDNEKEYGKEVRKKYGDDTVDASNAKLRDMTEGQYKEAQELSEKLNETIRDAFLTGDPASDKAMEACALHKQWLQMYWPDGTYSKQAHRGLAEMYVADERFKAYYEKIAPGCTEFLRDAIGIYCSE